MNHSYHVYGAGRAADVPNPTMVFRNPPFPTLPVVESAAPSERHAPFLTTVTFIAIVAAVILKVTLVGERDTGPRLMAAELGVQITDGGC